MLITQGANGSLHSYIGALVNEGDEICMFEPCFPMYFDHTYLSRGTVKQAHLEYRDGDWRFDPENLRKSLSSKTKLFLFNNPHNPTGKLFSREEMEQITKVLDEFPHVVVLSDEVYEFLTFDGREHTLFANIGNNWDRTISVFSGGKLFNATGWKVGWAIGPKKLIRLGGILNNTIFYCFNVAGQEAMGRSLAHVEAEYLGSGKTYIETIKQQF